MSNSTYFWSDTDKELLTKAYKDGEGLTEAAKLLPGKSRSTLAAQACRMKLTVPRPRKSKIHHDYGTTATAPGQSIGTCSLGGSVSNFPAIFNGNQSHGTCSFGS